MLRSSGWIVQGILALVALFFTLFGIELLMAAYKLKDPFSFIMTLFSASLIILISLALFAGFISRIIRKKAPHGKPDRDKHNYPPLP